MDIFFICVSCLSAILSCLFFTCCEMADLLALLYVVFSCVYGTFPYGVLGLGDVFDCINS